MAKWLDEGGSLHAASVRSTINGCRLLRVRVCESKIMGQWLSVFASPIWLRLRMHVDEHVPHWRMHVQGYLAHMEAPPPRTEQKAYLGPSAVSTTSEHIRDRGFLASILIPYSWGVDLGPQLLAT